MSEYLIGVRSVISRFEQFQHRTRYTRLFGTLRDGIRKHGLDFHHVEDFSAKFYQVSCRQALDRAA